MNEPLHSILLSNLLSSLPKDWSYEPIPGGTCYYDSDYNHRTAMLPRDFSDPTQVRIFKDLSCSIGIRCQHAGYVHTRKRLYLVMLSDAYPYVMFARQHGQTDDRIINDLIGDRTNRPNVNIYMLDPCFLVFGLLDHDYASRDPCFTIAAAPADVIRHINQSEAVPECNYRSYKFWEPSIHPSIQKVN